MANGPRARIIPVCLGTYERGLSDCDGDPEADGAAKRPCRWRRRCRGFQIHLKETQREPERYLKTVDLPPNLVQLSGRTQALWPHSKRLNDFNKWCVSFLPGGYNSTNKTGSHLIKAYAEARQAMTPTANMVFRRAKQRWRDVPIVLGHNGNVPILPGVLYTIKARKFIWLKLRVAEGHDVSILKLKFKLKLKLFDLYIRCDIRHFKATMSPDQFSALSPEPVNRNGYLTAVCDADGQRLGQAIDALAEIIRAGRLRFEGVL